MAIAEQHFSVIKKPRVTEKTMQQMAEGVYVFEVNKTANKLEIKAAIEAIWNVKVASVRTVKTKGENRRNKFGKFKTQSSRKAYISLKDGYAIELV